MTLDAGGTEVTLTGPVGCSPREVNDRDFLSVGPLALATQEIRVPIALVHLAYAQIELGRNSCGVRFAMVVR